MWAVNQKEYRIEIVYLYFLLNLDVGDMCTMRSLFVCLFVCLTAQRKKSAIVGEGRIIQLLNISDYKITIQTGKLRHSNVYQKRTQLR